MVGYLCGMSLLKKLAGETAIYGLSSILSRLLNFVILTPYLTRVFSRAEFGIISLLYTYAAILMVFYTYRMETAFFRFGSKPQEERKSFSTASISLLVSTAVFTALIFANVEGIAAALHFAHHPEYVRLVALIIALDALAAIPFARLRLSNRPLKFAVLKTGQIVVNLAFIFAFFKGLPHLPEGKQSYLPFAVDNRIAWLFLANVLASGLVMLALAPMYLKQSWQFDKRRWKQMFVYALPLVVVALAAVVNQLIALPMLERLLPGSLEENRALTGEYSAAAKLAVLMNLFTQAFNYAAEPFFFNHAARSDSRDVYGKVAGAFTLAGSIAFVAIVAYLDIVKLYLGPNLRGGVDVVPLLLLAYLFLGLYYNFSIWYKLSDQTGFGAGISLGGVLITLSLNMALIPLLGYYAPALAALACYGFMAAAAYFTGRSRYPIKYPIGEMLLYLLTAVFAVALSMWVRSVYANSLPLLLLLNTMLLLGYIAFWQRKIRAFWV